MKRAGQNPVFAFKMAKTKSIVQKFTDLEAWRVNHEAVLMIYKATKKFPATERYGLTNQLRRAASSITANIAEGWGRYHFADKIRFYHQARGSNAETQNFLILAKDLEYLADTEFLETEEKVLQGFRLVNGLIRSIGRQGKP